MHSHLVCYRLKRNYFPQLLISNFICEDDGKFKRSNCILSVIFWSVFCNIDSAYRLGLVMLERKPLGYLFDRRHYLPNYLGRRRALFRASLGRVWAYGSGLPFKHHILYSHICA